MLNWQGPMQGRASDGRFQSTTGFGTPPHAFHALLAAANEGHVHAQQHQQQTHSARPAGGGLFDLMQLFAVEPGGSMIIDGYASAEPATPSTDGPEPSHQGTPTENTPAAQQPSHNHHHPSGFDVHAPGTRSMFLDLKNRLNDMDAIYKTVYGQEDADADGSKTKFVPTAEMLERQRCLVESIQYFKTLMREEFDKFAEYENACRTEQQFLKNSSELCEKFQNPGCDHPEFHACAQEIGASLTALTKRTKERCSEATTKRRHHWAQYSGLRDMCKHVQEIQSDLICQLCYQCEVQVALGCGHLMCSACAARVSLCPSCRVHIQQRIPLFL